MGKVIEEVVIPVDGIWTRVMAPGEVLRIVDLEGKQAVDFLCYNAKNFEERYNAADTMKYAKTLFITTGHGVYSDMANRLFTIVEDTCGRHDTIGGCCSAESNEHRYGVKGTPYTVVIDKKGEIVARLTGESAMTKLPRILDDALTPPKR